MKKTSIRWASFRDLEIIKVLIEKGSVTVTADILGISQPAVSKSIANLEERSGKVFFVRERGRLIPTAEALYIYEEINNIFSSLERIDESNWKKTSMQTMKIITTPSVAYSFLAPITARYLKERSNLKISFSVVNTGDLINELREGRADIILGNTDINNNIVELSIHSLIKTRIVCLMNKKHELANKETMHIEDFNFRNVIMYTQRNVLSAKIRRKIKNTDTQANVIAEVSDSMLALEFVRGNVGLCLAPLFPLQSQLDDDVIFKDVDIDIFDEMAFLTLNNSLNPVYSDYIEYVKAQSSMF